MNAKQSPPKCCGKDATWVVQSHNLQYWYCKECKKEPGAKTQVGGLPDRLPETDEEMLVWFSKYVDDKVSKVQSQVSKTFQSVTLSTDDLKNIKIDLDSIAGKLTKDKKNDWTIPVARTREVAEQLAAEAREYAERISPDDVF